MGTWIFFKSSSNTALIEVWSLEGDSGSRFSARPCFAGADGTIGDLDSITTANEAPIRDPSRVGRVMKGFAFSSL